MNINVLRNGVFEGVEVRKFKGTIASGSEMVKEKVITEEQLKKTAGYIEY